MNNLVKKGFENKLKALEEFTEGRNVSYHESEIIDWIADCINTFYAVGVDSIIIRNFLDHFRTKTETIEVDSGFGRKTHQTVNAIGPFREEVLPLGYAMHKTGNYLLAGSLYYAKVIFSAAKTGLQNKLDEKRIVPLWLIEQMAENEDLKHISSSLELIEDKYEKKDTDGLINEANTLLGSVLNLDPILADKPKIGSKLNSLIENEDSRKLFGVSGDLLKGLNCGRILRNEKIVHKEAPLKYEIPFMIATSFAYLVLYFVECAILHGKILERE